MGRKFCGVENVEISHFHFPLKKITISLGVSFYYTKVGIQIGTQNLSTIILRYLLILTTIILYTVSIDSYYDNTTISIDTYYDDNTAISMDT